ncbi:MAG TPA: hypothetical protein VMU05_00740 [Dongiaceae bacterium]|nr:hypothetical protein [Dongiaceae bacterium]
MEYILNHPWELGLCLLFLLALVLEVGRSIAVRYRIPEVAERKEQMGTIRDGLFILVSLLLGFTLTLAASRFAERRALLVEEAVSIGTTYLRASTLPQPYRDHSRQLIREYVGTRLQLVDADLFQDAVAQSKVFHEHLWNDASAVAQQDRTAVTSLYLNSLNETIDIHEKRVAAFENRIPQAVWVLVISVSFIAVFTRGATLPSRFWLTLILLPVTIAIVVALIADLDTPGRGLIQLDQRALHRLQVDMSIEAAK